MLGVMEEFKAQNGSALVKSNGWPQDVLKQQAI